MRTVTDSSPSRQGFLIHPRILPIDEVHLLAGAAGVGKTIFMAGFLTQLRVGEAICGHETTPPTFIAFLAGDRPWHDHARWFLEVGWPDIPHYSLIDDFDGNLDELCQPTRRDPFPALTRAVGRLSGVDEGFSPPPGSLLLLDPLTFFLGVDPVMAGYFKTAQALAKLSRLCLQRHWTIVATYHAGKQRADKMSRYLRAQDKILGSTALLGFTGTQMFLSAPEETDQPYYELLWNPHQAPQEVFPLGRDEQTGLFIPYEDLERSEAERRVLDLIPYDETLRTNTIISHAFDRHSIARRVVERSLKTLTADRLIRLVVRGQYQRLRIS